MFGLERKIGPKSLVGQIMLVTAFAVLLVQGINTAIRFQMFKGRSVVEAASLAAAFAAHRIDRGGKPKQQRQWRDAPVAIMLSGAPLNPAGFRSTEEMAGRVTRHLQAIYPQISSVRLSVGPSDALPEMLQAERTGHRSDFAAIARHHHELGAERECVLLSLKLSDGSWIHTVAKVRRGPNMLPMSLLAETLLIYFGIMIPLLLVARRIAKPLRQLDNRLAQVGFASDEPHLTPAGPDDVRNLIVNFNSAETRLNALLTEKDVMLGAIGHDLKTPLAALRVRIESVEDESEREKMAATIEEMVQILDDILTLARLGKSSEEMQLTDIGALLETVADDLGGNGRITISDDATGKRATIRPVLLRRALRNLVGNALQYGKTAAISVDDSADTLNINIDDLGPGIAPDQIASMFEPFTRAEESRNRAHGGTGLGLTIARAIARAHGGDVLLENRAEGGLRATLRISQKLG